MAYGQFREFFGYAFVNIPVGARFPGRIDSLGQGMDKRVHVRSIQVVFLVPGCGRQNDIRIQTSRGHTKIQRDQQIEFTFCGFFMPDHFRRLVAVIAQILALYAMLGAEQIFQKVLMTLAR